MTTRLLKSATGRYLIWCFFALFSSLGLTAQVYQVQGVSMNAPFAIPDGDPTYSTVTAEISGIPPGSAITSITIDLGVSSTWLGDLSIFLEAPNGAGVLPIINRAGSITPTGGGDNSDLDGNPITFDDGAFDFFYTVAVGQVGGTICPGGGCFYKPGIQATFPNPSGATGPQLVTFSDYFPAVEDLNGTWTLYLSDVAGGDPSAFQSFSITINGGPPPSCGITNVVPTDPVCGTGFQAGESFIDITFDVVGGSGSYNTFVSEVGETTVFNGGIQNGLPTDGPVTISALINPMGVEPGDVVEVTVIDQNNQSCQGTTFTVTAPLCPPATEGTVTLGCDATETATVTGTIGSDEWDWYEFVFDGSTDLVSIDTEGSNLDTELGIYDASGTLVASDDDGGSGLLSLLSLNNLPAGTYYVVVGRFNTEFDPGFDVNTGIITGNSAGDYSINFNLSCNQAPVAVCQPVTVNADETCEAEVDPEDFDGGSSDPDGDMLSFSIDPAGPFELDVTNVTLTVSDGTEMSQCMTTVTVNDVTPPTITCTEFEFNFSDCPIGLGAFTPNGGFASLSAAGTIQLQVREVFTLDLSGCVADNCSELGDLDISLAKSTIVSRVDGCSIEYLNKYLLRDGAGNVSPDSICTRVTVSFDGPAPDIMCPADSLIDCGVFPAVSTEGVVATSGCGTPTITLSENPVIDGEPDVPGTTYTYTITAIDGCGNVSTCDRVFMVQDTTPPVVMANDTTLYLDQNGMATLTIGDYQYAVSDDCTAPFIADLFRVVTAPNALMNDQGADAGAKNGGEAKSFDQTLIFNCADVGMMIQVEVVGEDAAGNQTSDFITVTVLDTLGPVIMQTNFINVSVSSSQNPACPCPGSTFIEDNALNQDLLVSDIVAFGNEFFPGLAPFFLGIFEDNCTADEDIRVRVTEVNHNILANGNDSIVVYGVLVDEAGNESIQDTATIILIDDLDPELTCETDVTVFIDANGEASATDASAIILTLSDNCTDSAAIVTNLQSPVLGCDGATGTATLTVTDASGNTATCMVGLTPVDAIPPTAVCQDVTVELDEMGNASVQATSDAQPVTVVTGSLDASDPQFARPNGNGTTCTTTTGDDHFYDVFEFTIDAEDMYTFMMEDIVGPDFYFLLYEGGFDPNAPCDNFLIGDDDGPGSTEPEVMIELMLVPGEYTLVSTSFFTNAGALGPYTINISSANGGNVFAADENSDPAIDNGSTDKCGSDELTYALDVTDFTCDDLGANTVTLTVTDAAGLTSTCTATVTVEDNLSPVVATTGQIIVLNDNNVSQTLVTSDLVTATDNCGEPITIVFDRPLTFDGTDIGTNVLTATVTDANGNVTVVTVTVIVTFDQPNLACIGEINLTLNDECQALIIPSMVLTGNTGLIDAFPFSIVVQDSDPSNGPIIDGCGEFTYSISVPEDLEPTIGFTGAFDEDNFEVSIYDFFNAPNGPIPDAADAQVDFTQSSLTITTTGPIFGTAPSGRFVALVEYMFTETGTVSFDFNFTGNDPGFDGGVILYTFEGEEVDRILSTDQPANGSASIEVGPGNSLVIFVNDDGFSASATEITAQVLTITNFVFTPPVNPLALDFETCWGIVRAEDKTSPEAETVPDDVDLLCVDLDGNNLSTLPVSVSRCYRVDGQTGATIPGTMTAALRARLLAGRPASAGALVPIFTDGCAQQLEVCVSDAVAFGADPDCDDVVITRTFVATEVSTCVSASGEENAPAVASYTLTFERPTLADLNGNSIEAVVNIESCGSDPSARPAPRSGLGTALSPNDYPFLQVGGRTFFLENGEAVCNIGVTYSDGPSIVTCPNTYKFVRTYTVIDWCEPGDVRTFTQVVKVGDTTAPTLVGPNVATDADGTLVYGTNAGNICAAFIRLDDITVTDNCPGAVTVTAEIFPNRNLNGAPIGAFTVVPGGAPELTPAIPAGTHILRYTYTDLCGNTGVTDFDFRVEDQTPPVAICEDGLNISIAGGANNGFAVLTPANIDNGSYDDCSGVTLEIARVTASNLAIGDYGTQITLTCADIGTVRVGLRVTDALGNMNFCWLDVLVEDKLRPTCVAPANTTITCVDYNASLPNDITDASFAQLDALFGQAAGVDNCGTTITQTVSGTINSCGVGRITRSFTSTDDAGFTNTNVCRQVIDVIGIHDYRITFPTDEEGDCMEIPSFDAVVAEELACDLITTTVDVDTLRTQLAGDECFKLRVTYDVVNWCEYNSLGEPYIVRRDAPGARDATRNPRNIDEDLLYVNVIPGATTATIADDIAFYTLIRTDRIFNPAPSPQQDQAFAGYAANANDSRGFFRYTQFIKIYDEVAPEITFTEPAECFAGSGEGCRTTVTLEFTATDECSDATVTVMLDANFTGVFAADNAAALGISVDLVNDGEGNYTLTATNVPVGAHAIRVRANDGCGNSDVQIIEFCVTADRTPTPICIQTLTVTLMNDGNGGGIAAIWASDFIASPIVDCFGNVVDKYSLYRSSAAGAAGFTPVVGVLGIDDIDCDDFDNGTVSVRVYAFDDNGSTPDYCEVIVEVQDNMGWCDGSMGNLSGLIATPNDEVIAGVQVSLTSSAGMDATTTTSAAGTFSFTGLALNADYTVQPVFDAAFNAQNVRASDLVAGIGQILGTAPFTSAYQFVAADVNQDASFDVFDILAGQRAILGLDDGFAGGNWFMVEAGSAISMNDPYAVAFPEVFNANNLQGTVVADFVAVEKMNLTGATGRVAQTLRVDDAQLESGQLRTIILDGTHTAGFQGTIELAAGLELISADLTGQGGLNLNRAGEGLIAVLLREGGSVSLEVRATTSGLVSELITLSDAVTVREGVALNGTSNGLDLAFNADFAPATAQNVLHQNTPNPVVDETIISFELATAGPATLNIQDVAGRLVRTVEVDGVAGLNRVEVENLGAAGVYSYTLTSGSFTATRQMVVVE